MTSLPINPSLATAEKYDEKKPYTPPTLIEYGDINQVTQDGTPDIALNGSVSVTTI